MDVNESRRIGSKDAAQWWLILQEENVSRSERERFVDWLRESPIHVTELLRIAQLHGALEQFERWTHIATEDVSGNENVVPIAKEPAACGSHRNVVPPREAQPSLWKRWAIAASLCAISVLSWFVLGSRGQMIQTDQGERREVTLADGSVVNIDPWSRS